MRNVSICVTAVEKRIVFTTYILIVGMMISGLQLFLAPDIYAQTDKRDCREYIGGNANYRKIRVGLYENKPKIFTDESGKASGIFPTILNEIARKEQWELVYVPCEWNDCLDALQNGDIDLMPDVAFSPQRDEILDFHTESVVSSWSAVYARSRKHIISIADMNGKRIAVLKGSIQQTILRQMAQGFGLKVNFVEAQSFEEAFFITAKGDADAVVSNQFFGDYFYHQYGLEKTPVIFNPVSLYFATASGRNDDLLGAIDDNLRAMESEPGSIYYKALQAWLRQPYKAAVPQYFIWLLGGVSGVLVLAVLFIVLLRHQVGVTTRNLVHANELLRESEEKFRDLFQKHMAVKLIINPDGGAIVEANEAAEKYYGWTRDELLRMRIQDINTFPPEQVASEMEMARQKKRTHFEFQHKLANGSVRDVEVFSSAINMEGKAFLHSIIHDITDKHRLEQQYRQALKMESVGRLAGGIAHDYNNMLSVILGYTELALEQVNPSSQLHVNLTEVLKAAKRSIDITRQLLAFARRQTVEPKVLDLNTSMTEILEMLRRLIGEDVELIWKPGAELWPVYIDPSQLDQILANLCTNARDAITGVGTIIIETDNVTFDATYSDLHEGFRPGDFTMLAVSDDGCGMDREMLNNIFEPFFTTKEVGKGTGLGLATVYGIVKQNDGFINVYSEPGEGTTFRIYLPRHGGTVAGTNAESEEDAPPGSGETVLLVEDDRAILDLGRRILEKLGYEVLAAETPGKAMHLAENHTGEIDLLITDVIMPEMNGRDLSDSISARYPNMKTLFMSGYTADVITHRGILDEGVNFMQKPFSLKDLADKVSKALGKKRVSG